MRRRAIVRTTVLALAVGVAGCGQDGNDGTTTGGATPTATPAATPTATAEADTPGDGSSGVTETAAATGSSETTPTDTRNGGRTPAPTATATPTTTATPTATPAEADQVVEVGPGGSFSFDPESFELATGETVLWVWGSPGHNVVVESAPGGSDWNGDSEDLYDDGHTHTHTFTTAGEYEYYCEPHRSLGMVGTFTVVE